MSKKDYIRAAEIVREFRDGLFPTREFNELVASHIEQAFVDLFSSTNSRFDQERFIEACRKNNVAEEG